MSVRKLALFHSNLNPCGGAERLAVSTIEAMNKCGFNVSLITTHNTDWQRIFDLFGKRVKVNQEYHFPFSLPSKTYSPVLLTPFKFKEHRNRAIVFNSKGDTVPAVGDDITYLHSPYFLNEKFGYSNSSFWHVYMAPHIKIVKEGLRYSKRILTNSLFSRDRIRSLLNRNAEVVYPPVALESYKRLLHPKEARKDIVAICSRFAADKRLELLPKIASQTHGTYYVMGASEGTSANIIGHLKKQIAKYGIQEKVILRPDVSNEEKINILSKSKVFLHLKPNEDFGIGIVEAMAAGCTPIVHDSGGPREFVPQEWRYNNTDEISEKIRQALDSWSLSKAEDISRITDRFDEANYQRKIMEIIDDAIRNQ
jgi:alpha-1,2-mannosyltransferase